jgi:hypothetical protein
LKNANRLRCTNNLPLKEKQVGSGSSNSFTFDILGTISLHYFIDSLHLKCTFKDQLFHLRVTITWESLHGDIIMAPSSAPMCNPHMQTSYPACYSEVRKRKLRVFNHNSLSILKEEHPLILYEPSAVLCHFNSDSSTNQEIINYVKLKQCKYTELVGHYQLSVS